jgi:hypothetical protein
MECKTSPTESRFRCRRAQQSRQNGWSRRCFQDRQFWKCGMASFICPNRLIVVMVNCPAVPTGDPYRFGLLARGRPVGSCRTGRETKVRGGARRLTG